MVQRILQSVNQEAVKLRPFKAHPLAMVKNHLFHVQNLTMSARAVIGLRTIAWPEVQEAINTHRLEYPCVNKFYIKPPIADIKVRMPFLR